MGLSQVNERPILEDLCTQSTYWEKTDLSNLWLSWCNVQELHLAESNSFSTEAFFVNFTPHGLKTF